MRGSLYTLGGVERVTTHAPAQVAVKFPVANSLRQEYFAENTKVAWPVGVTVLAAIYFATGKLGLSISPVAGFATLVWPPTGISLAALLIFGYRLWPGIFLGAFLVNVHTGASFPVALCIATGNTLEAVLGSYLLQRFAGFHSSLDRVRHVLGLVIFAALLSTTVSASMGVTSLWFGNIISEQDFGFTWRTWWVGDVMGDLIVAPLLLIWATRPRLRFNPWRTVEASILATTLLVLSLATFAGRAEGGPTSYLNPYFIFPVLVWASLRFGQRGGITATFALSVIAIWSSVHGFGSFRAERLSDSLLHLQTFIGIAAIMVLLLGAAVSERKQALEALRTSHDELELRVQSRTLQLSRANEALLAQIAERKQTTQALRKSEEQARRIIDTALDAFVSIDDTGVITDWNPQAETTFGWSRAEAIGRPLAETIIPAELREAHRRGLERFLKTGEGPLLNLRFEIVALHRDGHEFPVEITISPVQLEHGYAFHAFVHDITKRKSAEDALRAEKDRFRLLADHAQDMIYRYRLSPERRFEYVSPSATTITGYSPEEHYADADLAFKVVHPDDRPLLVAYLQSSFEVRGPLLLRWTRKDGTAIWIEQRLVPIRDEAGQLECIEGIARDVTQRRMLEKQVLEAAETERQRIAHDLHDGLCNHLAGIAFRAELAAETLREKSLPEAENLSRIAGLLRDAIAQAHRLAKGLRPVIGGPLGLMSALDELTLNASNLYGVECRFQFQRPIAIQDSAKAVHLYWIANEAVHNAIRHGKAKHVRLTLNNQGERCSLAIEDDGTGLPALLPKNHGLGLNIMQYRARMIGGALDVHRGRTGGTVVTCAFPSEPISTNS